MPIIMHHKKEFHLSVKSDVFTSELRRLEKLSFLNVKLMFSILFHFEGY